MVLPPRTGRSGAGIKCSGVLLRQSSQENYVWNHTQRERENIVNIDLSYRYLGYIQYPTIDSLPRIHFVSNHRYLTSDIHFVSNHRQLTSDTFCIQLQIPRIHFVSNHRFLTSDTFCIQPQIPYLGYILYPIIDTKDTFCIQHQIPWIHSISNYRYLGYILYPIIDTQDTFCIQQKIPRIYFVSNYRYLTQDRFCIEPLQIPYLGYILYRTICSFYILLLGYVF